LAGNPRQNVLIPGLLRRCYERLLALLMPVRMVPPSVGSIFDGVMYESGFDGWVLLQQCRHPCVGVGVHGVDAPRDDLLVGRDLDVDVVDVGGIEWKGHVGSILQSECRKPGFGDPPPPHPLDYLDYYPEVLF
jgi:hypothetical protein